MLTLPSTAIARATRQSASRRAVSVMGSWRNVGTSARSASALFAKRFAVAAVRFGGCISSSMSHSSTTSLSADYRNTRNTRESVSLALAVPAVPATAALHT